MAKMEFYEDTRCSFSLAICLGGPPTSGGHSGKGRDVPGRGGANLWRIATIGEQLDEIISLRRASKPERRAARATFCPAPYAASGGHGCAVDQRPLSGPAEAAFYALEAGSSGGSSWPAVAMSRCRCGRSGTTCAAGYSRLRSVCVEHKTETPSWLRQLLQQKYPAIGIRARLNAKERRSTGAKGWA